jgi:hypothetical protein
LKVPVIRLRAKKFKEAFNGLLQDTWVKVDFKRICTNKKQGLINLVHVQEGLVGGTKTITQGLGEEDSFSHNWSYKSNFDVILDGMETRLPYLSNDIWHAF